MDYSSNASPGPDIFGASVPARLAGLIGMVGANLGILVVYVRYDLDLFQLLAVYWWEGLWIGVFCALRLVVASLIGDPYSNRIAHVSKSASLFLSLLALGFVATQFLTVFFLVGFFLVTSFSEVSGSDPSELLAHGLGPVLGSSLLFLISHGITFVAWFIIGREYRNVTAFSLLALPLRRCISLGATIFVAAICALYLPQFSGVATFGFLVIALKLFFDYRTQVKEGRQIFNSAARETSP